jgi:hypothetical protein
MIELLGGGTSVRISPTVWTMTLELSRIAGWQPAGTRWSNGGADSAAHPPPPPPPLSWLMQYTTSDGQMVDTSDAGRLADALERAATNCDQLVNDYQQGRIDAPPLRTPGTGFSWFCTKPGREHLRALADFCRRGSFRIH